MLQSSLVLDALVLDALVLDALVLVFSGCVCVWTYNTRCLLLENFSALGAN